MESVKNRMDQLVIDRMENIKDSTGYDEQTALKIIEISIIQELVGGIDVVCEALEDIGTSLSDIKCTLDQ